MKRILFTVAVLLLWASTAQAGMFELRAGVRGGGNGVTWMQADQVPLLPTEGSLHWATSQTLGGGGGGAFVDVRIFKFLGVSLDLLGASNSFKFTQSIGNFTYEYTTSMTQFRVPLLFKLALPAGPLELTLGIGPEFVAGLGAEVSVSEPLVAPYYQANATGGTFLDGELGINMRFGNFYLPISFRIGYNVSQSGDYADRVSLTPGPPLPVGGITPPIGTVNAIETLNYGVWIGLGWTFMGGDSGDED